MKNLDKEKLLNNSKAFCMYPWVHLYAEPKGDVHPCCTAVRQGEHDIVENLKDKTLEEIFKGKQWSSLRKQMMNDERNPVCTRCYQVEDSGGYSYRSMANSQFGEFFDYVERTNDDGTVEEFNYKFIDVRFSNNCNFSCSTCGPFWSSNWSTHLKKNILIQDRDLSWVDSFERSIKDNTKVDIFNQIKPHLITAKSIYFAGGEPLLMPEHYQILDYLIENNVFDIQIRYNTNMSSLDFKYNIVEKWKNFNNIYVGASIDGVQDVAETIRYGTVWPTVENNLKRVKQFNNIKLGIDTVISIFNIDHLPDMYEYLIEKGIIDNNTAMSFNVAFDPPPFSLTGLPTKYKPIAEKKLSDWAAAYNGPHSAQVRKSFSSIINFMYSKDTYDAFEYVFHYEERLGVQFDQAIAALPLPYAIYKESLDQTKGERYKYSRLK